MQVETRNNKCFLLAEMQVEGRNIKEEQGATVDTLAQQELERLTSKGNRCSLSVQQACDCMDEASVIAFQIVLSSALHKTDVQKLYVILSLGRP
eukprot:346254-Pelagomonas_calceolata.AAC.10